MLRSNRTGSTAILSDFKKIYHYMNGKKETKKLFNQNKGQKEMMQNLFDNLISEGTSPQSLSMKFVE